MLFRNKTVAPADDAKKAAAFDDVVDVDAKDVSAVPAATGLFVNASDVASTGQKPSLFAKFGRKRNADAPASAPEAVGAPQGAAKRPKAQPSADANRTLGADSEKGDKVVSDDKKSIIVKRASDKKKKFAELPIRVFIGFLPEVTERDARDYALGIAERNCDQLSLAFFDAFKCKNGYAYEVQEGGSGRALLPSIIEYFESLGPYSKAKASEAVYIRTATRTVQVERTHEGLQAFLLPESSTEAATDWLEGSSKMTPAVHTLMGVLVFGAAVFITGFLGMSVALYSRIQPYEAAPAPSVLKATDSYNNSPLSRWTSLQGVGGSEYIKALRYRNGKWELERGTVESAQPTPVVPATPSN